MKDEGTVQGIRPAPPESTSVKPHGHELTLAPEVDVPGLISFLDRQSDVLAAYLFGSVAEGRSTPLSDVDIAVLLDAEKVQDTFLRRLQLMGELERFATRPVDVVVLNDAPLLLRYQVLRHGRLLYDRDPRARVEFEVRVGELYDDLQPSREFFSQTLFQEIRERKFGQRRHRVGTIDTPER